MADISGWQPAAVRALRAGRPLVLVTVLRSAGSVPRGAGAKIWVDDSQTWGTIGGGHLEFQAIDLAREMLQQPAPVARQVKRYALGPSLGQCCGGVIWLAFERLGPDDLSWVEQVERRIEASQSVSRQVNLLDNSPVQVQTAEQCVSGLDVDLAQWDEPSGVLNDTLAAPGMTVVVCGAGHVGQALINILATLPLRVFWLDPRDDIFPPVLPANVQCIQGGAEDVRDLPDDACWLVLTHSHALDLEIVNEVLGRHTFRFLGLIGSATKKARFISRLRQRFPEELVSRMVCPIGVVKTSSKLPEVIAISAVAQLLDLD